MLYIAPMVLSPRPKCVPGQWEIDTRGYLSSNARHVALGELLGQMWIVFSSRYYNKCQEWTTGEKTCLAHSLEASGYALWIVDRAMVAHHGKSV